jgi:hypothetical protein
MEPTEQNIPIPPAKKIQPHQVALWFAIGFVTFSYLSLVLFGTDLILEGFGLFVSCLVRPGIWLALHLGLNNVWSYLVIMAWGLMAWYLTYYIPVKLWMTSSRHMRMVLISLVILCFIAYGTYQCYSAKKPDWTSQGLNPDWPGFEPQAITLSGEYGKGRDIFFEIRMHGFDYYYARRWHGNDWKPGPGFIPISRAMAKVGLGACTVLPSEPAAEAVVWRAAMNLSCPHAGCGISNTLLGRTPMI